MNEDFLAELSSTAVYGLAQAHFLRESVDPHSALYKKDTFQQSEGTALPVASSTECDDIAGTYASQIAGRQYGYGDGSPMNGKSQSARFGRIDDDDSG